MLKSILFSILAVNSEYSFAATIRSAVASVFVAPPSIGSTVSGVLGSFLPSVPFSTYSNITIQVRGQYPLLSSINDNIGIVGPDNVLGSPIRFGKFPDPTNSSKKVFRHALRTSDPYTAGDVHRVDLIVPAAQITKDEKYWVAFKMFLPDNTYFANDYTTLVNLHPGGSTNSGDWSFQINKGVFQFVQGYIPPNSSNVYHYWNSSSLANQWVKVVLKFKMSLSASGYIKVWINNTPWVNVSGVNTAPEVGDYLKQAFYNYSFGGGFGDLSRHEREMFYDGFYVLRDEGQSSSQINALLD